jgi:hypothetical protein
MVTPSASNRDVQEPRVRTSHQREVGVRVEPEVGAGDRSDKFPDEFSFPNLLLAFWILKHGHVFYIRSV